MKQERKIELLNSFPELPEKYRMQMNGKGAWNYVVFLVRSSGGELFARCYHRYSDGQIIERQRYVFAKDGAVRYGKDDWKPWEIRKDFREPIFCQGGYSYSFDNRYSIINRGAIKKSWMKYADFCLNKVIPIEYLRVFCRHPNYEYLEKTGYGFLVQETYTSYYAPRRTLCISPYINWKSNNLLKMLGLTKTEFKALQGREELYPHYIKWREKHPRYGIDDIISIAKVFGHEQGTAERLTADTGVKLRRLARYLHENRISTRDYSDYVEQCKKLKYDLHDTAVSMPHDFMAMHTRLSNIIKYGSSEGLSAVFRERMDQRKQLEYESGRLIIKQPASYDEIVAEGSKLHHCVGGYAERHALGKLHIMFIRKKDKPEEPYYTMEVSVGGAIVQVRGSRNCDMTKEVSKLVENYKKHLAKVFGKAKQKIKVA